MRARRMGNRAARHAKTANAAKSAPGMLVPSAPAPSGAPDTPDTSAVQRLNLTRSAPQFHELSTPPPPGYIFDRLVGEGGFAEVFLAHSTGAVEVTCAIKAISKLICPPASIEAEVESLERCSSHPSIESLFEVIHTEDYCYIVTEYCTGGELFERIVEKGSFTEGEAKIVVKQLLEGVQHLHLSNVLHRDLKPENILLESADNDTSIKLADFGIAKVVGHGDTLRASTFVGSPEYMAPECLFSLAAETNSNEKFYTGAADVWSIGVICYILLCGQPPHCNVEDLGLADLGPAGKAGTNSIALRIFVDAAASGNIPFPSAQWQHVSQDAKTFIRGLLTVDPSSRWTIETALASAWLKHSQPTPMSLQKKRSRSEAVSRRLSGYMMDLAAMNGATGEKRRRVVRIG